MIQVGQTLHGYDSGHSLLASSEELPYNTESILFVLSDLSGQSFVSGFESYLSGFPLSEISLYALARTWYAPEMERPGCVWTHTLLIRFSDLAKVSSLSPLLELFSRPSKMKGPWPMYEKKLRIDIERTHRDRRLSHDSIEVYSSICDSLYSEDEAPVLIPADSGQPFERPFIEVWTQQWPRLRRGFTFCTGAIEGRELSGRPFDLQCIPAGFSSLGSAPPLNAIIVDEISGHRRLSEAVLSTMLEDLEHPDERMREFMRNYGADAPARRTAFASLVSVWLRVMQGGHSPEAFDRLLRAICDLFPLNDDVAKLKSDLVIGDTVGALFSEIPLEIRIMTVIRLADESHLLETSLKLKEYFSTLAKSRPPVLIQVLEKLIRSRSINRIGHVLIRVASFSLDWKMVREHASPNLLMVLAGTNPDLIKNRDIWHILQGRTHELVELFASINASRDQWDTLCCAAIKNDATQVAPLLFERAGKGVVETVLTCFESIESYRDVFGSWFAELEKRQTEVAGWLVGKERICSVNQLGLTLVLDPLLESVWKLGSTLWRGVERDGNARRLAFLFVVTARDSSGEAAPIFSATFRKLHKMARGNDLDYYAWRILRDALPHIASWKDWDIGERLRILYCRSFYVNGWPIQEFWNGLESLEVTREAFELIASEGELQEFGRRLVRSAREYAILPWQLDLLPSLSRVHRNN